MLVPFGPESLALVQLLLTAVIALLNVVSLWRSHKNTTQQK